jgi:hypothetical protein
MRYVSGSLNLSDATDAYKTLLCKLIVSIISIFFLTTPKNARVFKNKYIFSFDTTEQRKHV